MNHGVCTELGPLVNRVHIQFTKSCAMALGSPTNEGAAVLKCLFVIYWPKSSTFRLFNETDSGVSRVLAPAHSSGLSLDSDPFEIPPMLSSL